MRGISRGRLRRGAVEELEHLGHVLVRPYVLREGDSRGLLRDGPRCIGAEPVKLVDQELYSVGICHACTSPLASDCYSALAGDLSASPAPPSSGLVHAVAKGVAADPDGVLPDWRVDVGQVLGQGVE